MTGTRKQNGRQSNIELLRIIAMTMVVVLHINYFSGYPTKDTSLASTIIWLITEGLSSVCIPVFILISGWFGIQRPQYKAASIIFQSVFIIIGVSFINSLVTHSAPQFIDIIFHGILLNDYWFIIAYLGVLILSPILNLFAESSDNRTFGIILLALFVLQSIYGWLFDMVGFENGMSVISLCIFYLLGCYLKKNMDVLDKIRISSCLLCYFASSLISAGVAFLLLVLGFPGGGRLFIYTSPFVIIGAVSLFILFLKIKFQNRLVNLFSASIFAVYILHMHPLVSAKIKSFVNGSYEADHIIIFITKMTVLIIGLFAFSYIIDLIRKKCWEKCMSHYKSRPFNQRKQLD